MAGAAVAAWAPLQTFPRLEKRKSPFFGCYFTFQGDHAALLRATELTAGLRSELLLIKPALKPGIHLAAVFSSSFLLALLSIAQDYLKQLNTPEVNMRIFWPLIKQTVNNAEKVGLIAAITGPIARREGSVNEIHKAVLKKEDKKLYELLSKKIEEILQINPLKESGLSVVKDK
jgi:predicted short-subunit dehydrogenase-like oxidoreductase (DUF2520 family)